MEEEVLLRPGVWDRWCEAWEWEESARERLAVRKEEEGVTGLGVCEEIRREEVAEVWTDRAGRIGREMGVVVVAVVVVGEEMRLSVGAKLTPESRFGFGVVILFLFD